MKSNIPLTDKNMENRLFSITQTGQILGLSNQHVERLIKIGKLKAEPLPSSKQKKIPASSIISFQKEQKLSSELMDNLFI